MSSQAVQPLRISKNTPSSSPSKMASNSGQRPLSELNPMGVRRNSPSFDKSINTKSSLFKGESSPFDSSPLGTSNSPRLFWQGRDPGSPNRLSTENRNPFEREAPPIASAKRSSIENLKRASRVKNSSMFAKEQKHEYDPSQVTVLERPLAGGRPLAMQSPPSNAHGSRGLLDHLHKEPLRDVHQDEPTKSDLYKPATSPTPVSSISPLSPSKTLVSPTKSSLSKGSRTKAKSMGFEPENAIWSDEEDSLVARQLPEGRVLHRHAKSVTFDQAPPQVNEYEMTTPDPSSIASGSREGSYDSTEGYEDESYERGSSLDREDSFDASLEDTDKTPVVLPEDWRFMSPAAANHDLARHEEDPFSGEYGSPEPHAKPNTTNDLRQHQSSMTSVDSNGERRPLPPLPGLAAPLFSRERSGSNNSEPDTTDHVSSLQRMLPSPPTPASTSKPETKAMGGDRSMSLEDRLNVMMLQDQDTDQSEAEKQRERRMRRAGASDRSPQHDEENNGLGVEVEDHEDTLGMDHQSPPRISRESILRKIRSQQELDFDEYDYPSQPSLSPERQMPLDPDVPIPSLEGPPIAEEHDQVVIKEEPNDEVDVYSIPDLYSHHQDSEAEDGEDSESQYSRASFDGVTAAHNFLAQSVEEGQETPRAQSPEFLEPEKQQQQQEIRRMSLPEFANILGDHTFDLGLGSYMHISPPPTHPQDAFEADHEVRVEPVPEALKAAPEVIVEPVPFEEFERPVTPDAQLRRPRFLGQDDDSVDEPGTPDSVIRHPVADSPTPDSPRVPEPDATIKAPGGRLKTRPSITPSDAASMAAARRQVSGQEPEPAVPAIPDRHMTRSSLSSIEKPGSSDGSTYDDAIEPERHVKRKSSLVQLEIPTSTSDEGLGFGLDREFDRVIEAQKVAFELSLSQLHTPFYGRFPSFSQDTMDVPNHSALPGAEHSGRQRFTPNGRPLANRSAMRQRGYLMRQNTKVVVASSRNDDDVKSPTLGSGEHDTRTTKSANNSPRKPSQQTWVTEPWNGQTRQKSVKVGAISPRKKPVSGPAPPLPGQQSNVKDTLDSVEEDEVVEQTEEYEDGEERGRLFVKVIGVKDLDLPLPRGERSHFALTLDNGLHCVTTAWLELGRNAPIGQEFELVVLNDLEFQLTLQMKVEEPKPEPVPQSLPKAPSSPKKPSTFSRVFGSPKKRKEAEAKQMEQSKQQRPPSPVKQSPYDLVKNLVARDGSFARAYISLSEHQQHTYGRPYVVDITCFNEWALEESGAGSSQRSKKGVNGGVQRRPPYKIGKLELQLLYVPKPKGAKDEDMPKSMNACIREMKEAETTATRQWEGHLSQQGGDCPFWRRRFFKLAGSKLTAYHESTHQPRATINLAKAAKLIDDKSALMQKETSTRGGGRRKSAFAEEEEGYMFVEEGFRVRFANGEVIDFYADSAAEKDNWMKVLCEVVGKSSSSSGSVKGWTEMVLKHERTLASAKDKPTGHNNKPHLKAQASAPQVGVRQSSKEKRVDQVEKVKRGSGVGMPVPQPVEKSPRHQVSPQKAAVINASPQRDANARSAARQQKTRSMVF